MTGKNIKTFITSFMKYSNSHASRTSTTRKIEKENTENGHQVAVHWHWTEVYLEIFKKTYAFLGNWFDFKLLRTLKKH